jgi:hypothetical protein
LKTVKTLEERIGDLILISCPLLGGSDIIEVRLHAVETAGLWLETNKFTELLHAERPSEKDATPVVFVPFAKIDFVLSRTL